MINTYRQFLFRFLRKNIFILTAAEKLSFLIPRENYRNRLKKLKLENQLYKKLNYDRTILSGPFKGMKYVSFESLSSELPPKILGCYEHELEPTINNVLNTAYDKIMDIGCAEGYYAVGFAKFGKMKKVEAYDIEPYALELCKKMATENKVLDKIEIREEAITPEKLKKYPFVGKNLILCDCEGYEIELFTKETIQNLLNCEVLIEVHHTLNPAIPSALKEAFKNTHKLQIINTTSSDHLKFDVLNSFTAFERRLLLSEGRDMLIYDTVFEWYYFTPLN